MTQDRLIAVVSDAATGEPLEGVPTPMLYRAGVNGDPVLAYHREGEWILVGNSLPSTLDWHTSHGHELRRVTVQVPR